MNDNEEGNSMPAEEERMIDSRYIRPEVVEICHEDMRRQFEPHIMASAALAEVRVFTALTLRLVRLAKASKLLCQAGLIEESQLQLRSASEITVNLLYIMNVGPNVSSKSTTQLAEQFLAYGDLAYAKMLRRRREKARVAFKKHQGMSDADFDNFLSEKERLAENAARVHGCTSSRWHNMNLSDMAEKVRDNPPAFFDEADKQVADVGFSSFVGANSATHGDALSLRSQYKALGNAPLELIYEGNPEYPIYADVVATETIWAWKIIGEYYNQLNFVDQCLRDSLKTVLKKRYDDGVPTSNV